MAEGALPTGPYFFVEAGAATVILCGGLDRSFFLSGFLLALRLQRCIPLRVPLWEPSRRPLLIQR